ncbi:TPA: hypothetical protein ACIBFG_004423, partial [Salmonella enterica subsp. enterica serovar Bahrenfeld]
MRVNREFLRKATALLMSAFLNNTSKSGSSENVLTVHLAFYKKKTSILFFNVVFIWSIYLFFMVSYDGNFMRRVMQPPVLMGLFHLSY